MKHNINREFISSVLECMFRNLKMTLQRVIEIPLQLEHGEKFLLWLEHPGGVYVLEGT